ncbi:MAG: PDZ domain-containing protein [Acidobacteria bacterium]|nr:PDZ domain-containing protein [Acidobacteriota bacterium]
MRFRVSLPRTLLLAGGIFVFAATLLPQAETPPDDVTEESLRFTKVYALIEENFVEPLDPDRSIFDGGIRGLLRTLDPFSSFLDKDQFDQLKDQTRGKTRGFGSVLYVQPGKIMILQAAEGSPAWRAGLGPGDEIVEVNGTRINRLDLESLVRLLQRARSQRVRLGVVRPGQVVAQDFELFPAQLNLPSVDQAFLLEPGIAYLHISGFDQKTPREVADAANRLGGGDLKGLLLDLRNNFGGVLESAVQVASLFLPPEQPVLTVRGRAFPERTERTREAPARFDMPLIVLVNGNTASASEVLTAALQEHDRALVVGEPSFGKGVVESVAELSEGTGLALTTAQYFTPSGRSIQRPIPGTVLAAAATGVDPASDAPFRTASGRQVTPGGGITPDVAVSGPRLDPWVTFLNQRGSFTSFSSEFLTASGRVDRAFEPDSKVLASFRDYLGRHRILVPEEYWGQDEDYLKLRIKTELFNLVFGLAVGEEVETRGDPQVQEALSLFPKISQLMKPSAHKTQPARLKRTGP